MPETYEPRTVVDPGPAGLGTAFAKLDAQERKFVIALLELSNNDRTQATILAGFTGTPAALRARGYRLYHDPRIQEALHEMSLERLAGAKPMLTSELLDIAKNGKSESARLRAIEMALNRIGMHQVTQHNVMVQDKSKTREAMEMELKRLVDANPGAIKLLPPNLQKLVALPISEPNQPNQPEIVDATFTEVKEEWE